MLLLIGAWIGAPIGYIACALLSRARRSYPLVCPECGHPIDD